MGVEKQLKPSLRVAVEGRWGDFDWYAVKSVCQSTRPGLDDLPGSENHGVLAWLCALMVAWKRPQDLHRIALTAAEIVSWWAREMTDRLRKDLQLTETRSRIYCEWGAPLICWLYPAFKAFPDLRELHLCFVRATAALVALCAYPARPKRYEPPVEAKMFKADLFVPLAGARSWSGEMVNGVPHVHHLGQSGWEPFAADLLGIPVPTEFDWHRALPAKLQPGWQGMSSIEVGIFRDAITHAPHVVLDDLMGWLYGVGQLWPCRLVRFERGSACIGLGRELNGNTKAISTMAIHEDGTIHFLASNSVARNHELEPCGVNEFDHGNGRVKYVCWRGGEDEPYKELVLHPDRWGRVVWDVHLQRDGHHVVRRPEVPHPVPPPVPPPTPPGPKPDEDPCEDSGGLSRIWCRIRQWFRETF